jgi:hypothetical protein
VKIAVAALALSLVGCAPSAEERQAEALLARAQELALTSGKYQARASAHLQAEKLYKEIIAQYPKTKAAKMAASGLERMTAIFEADKKIAAEELGEAYQAAIGDVLKVASPQR